MHASNNKKILKLDLNFRILMQKWNQKFNLFRLFNINAHIVDWFIGFYHMRLYTSY